MKELGILELREAVSELEEFEAWQGFTKFARDFYGPNAHKVTVSTTSEYNDNGGYYNCIESVMVYDSEDNELKPDFTLPAFLPSGEYSKEIANHEKYYGKLNADDMDNVEDFVTNYGTDLGAPEGDDGEYEYLVGDPPKRKYGKIFVEG